MNCHWSTKPSQMRNRKFLLEFGNLFHSFVQRNIHSSCRVRQKKGHSSALRFSSDLRPSKNDKETVTHSLYPYQTKNIGTIFVYGTDIGRLKNIWSIPASTQMVFIILVAFMNVAAVILYIVRKRMKLRGNGMASTIIDTMVAFTAGGNLRMHHKVERWFFGIMLISAFFITSIFMGDLLGSVYRIRNKINTFEQLSEVKSPIYIHPVFGKQANFICDVLRLDATDSKFCFSSCAFT